MPGFKIGGTGEPANSTVESRRKHRWRFSTIDGLSSQVPIYLASAQRPHVITEEAIMHHDQEQAAFAGKHHWEPISLVFYDISGQGGPDSSREIWAWLNTVINIAQVTVALPSAYKKTAQLEMTGGTGNADETWKIYNAWPIDLNWNDVDYSNNEIQTVDVSMKYDRAIRQ